MELGVVNSELCSLKSDSMAAVKGVKRRRRNASSSSPTVGGGGDGQPHKLMPNQSTATKRSSKFRGVSRYSFTVLSQFLIFFFFNYSLTSLFTSLFMYLI